MTNTNMEQQQSSYKEKERIDLREPRRFKVTIFNDDFTTMEFVVKILTTVFFKSTMEAEALMMQVHKSESAVIGIYTYDIAGQKYKKPPVWLVKRDSLSDSRLHRKKNKKLKNKIWIYQIPIR